MNKRLIFHFYANNGWRDNIANRCHFNCLNYFSDVFTDSVIVIVNDGLPDNEILEIKKKFVEVIKSGTITVKVTGNTPFYEGNTFYNEVIIENEKYNGLIFFAHNKGVSNVDKKEISKNAVLSWICGLYYYGLKFEDEVERELCSNQRSTFYGPYLMKEDYINNKNHIWYAGTFYWVNPCRLFKNFDEIPKLFDREYAEWLPGELGNHDYLKSHGNIILQDSDLYHNWQYSASHSSLSEEEYNDFVSFKDKMTSFFKEYRYSILTCNFNKYEIMREISGKQDDVEYIYVTDDYDLKSDTWNIVYDKDLDGLESFQKVQKVRENPFKYCSTSTCVRIDASIEVIGSIDKLVDDFHRSNADIGIMVHPERDNIFDEYDAWASFRKMDGDEKERIIPLLENEGCNLSIKGLYETGLMICVNNVYTESFLSTYSKIMERLNVELGRVRVDQAVFSAVMNTYGFVNTFKMSHQCIQSKSLQSMEHCSCFTCIVHNIPSTGYFKGTMVNLYEIK